MTRDRGPRRVHAAALGTCALVVAAAAAYACSGTTQANTVNPDAATLPAQGDGPAADSAVPSVGCGKTAAGAGGVQTGVSIKVGGNDRTYVLYLPQPYDPAKAYPIVFVYHGDGGSGSQIRSSFKIEAEAKETAIFVYPDGEGHHFDLDTAPATNPDALMFDAVVASLGQTYCVDTKHVFAAGFSGGAYFANQLGCWRGGALRAIASNSGGGPYTNDPDGYDANGKLVCPGSPIPAMIVHGESDTNVDPSEGQKSVDYWTYADKCESSSSPSSPSPCVGFNGCTNAVVFCSIPGMGHSIWSLSPAAMWGFFSSLP